MNRRVETRRMDRTAFLATIRRESEALAEAAATVDPGTLVPSCPGWSMARPYENTPADPSSAAASRR
jgi:hypothetical protein